MRSRAVAYILTIVWFVVSVVTGFAIGLSLQHNDTFFHHCIFGVATVIYLGIVVYSLLGIHRLWETMKK